MELERALADALACESDLVAAWLFGSRARGTARADSDVVVAVFVEAEAFGPERAWDLEASLGATLGLPVQVVIVNRVGADLFRRVLRDGVLLVDRDRARRIRFEVKKRNEYFDMTPIWRQIRRLPPGTAP